MQRKRKIGRPLLVVGAAGAAAIAVACGTSEVSGNLAPYDPPKDAAIDMAETESSGNLMPEDASAFDATVKDAGNDAPSDASDAAKDAPADAPDGG